LTNQNLNIKTSKPILLCERLFEPDDFDAFYHFEVLLAAYYSAMLKYYYEIHVSHFQHLNFGPPASTIQANTPKEQLLFLFDHTAVLQISLVMLFRGYISISFLPILSLI